MASKNRLMKKDKEIVRQHLKNLGDHLLQQGAAQVRVDDWSGGRLGLNVYWGDAVSPHRPEDTCERLDWVCVSWDHRDGAWRLYGTGAPVHTEFGLKKVLAPWRRDFRLFQALRDHWKNFQSSSSEKRWMAYLGVLAAALHVNVNGGQPSDNPPQP